MKAIHFAIVFSIPAIAFLGSLLGGSYHFLTPVVVFGLVPLLDWFLGVDETNPDPDDEEELGKSSLFRVIPMLTTPIQLALLIWSCHIVARGSLAWWEVLGLSLSVGISGGGMGITAAHEMVHRLDSALERVLAHINLLLVCYMHWGDEHVKGHHLHVSTPEDPTSARIGEPFYAFLPRTLIGTYRHAWELEVETRRRKKQEVDSLGNRMVWFSVLPILLGIALGLFWQSIDVTLFFFLQAFVAVVLLEATNYIEHYGLRRKEKRGGKYERVSPLHSWNASNYITNLLLFNLQRHSDHHAKPRRRYQLLRHFDESPQLPTGYAGMILVALIPPLWRRLIDPLVPESMVPKEDPGMDYGD